MKEAALCPTRNPKSEKGAVKATLNAKIGGSPMAAVAFTWSMPVDARWLIHADVT
jgi:hypothetical protein